MLSLVMNDYLMNKFKWVTTMFALGLGVSVAIISEAIQTSIPGRAGTFTDVFIDLGGYILFAGLVYLIYFLIIRHKNKVKSAK